MVTGRRVDVSDGAADSREFINKSVFIAAAASRYPAM